MRRIRSLRRVPVCFHCMYPSDALDHTPLSTKDLLSCMRNTLALRDHPADRERDVKSWRGLLLLAFGSPCGVSVRPIP